MKKKTLLKVASLALAFTMLMPTQAVHAGGVNGASVDANSMGSNINMHNGKYTVDASDNTVVAIKIPKNKTTYSGTITCNNLGANYGDDTTSIISMFLADNKYAKYIDTKKSYIDVKADGTIKINNVKTITKQSFGEIKQTGDRKKIGAFRVIDLHKEYSSDRTIKIKFNIKMNSNYKKAKETAVIALGIETCKADDAYNLSYTENIDKNGYSAYKIFYKNYNNYDKIKDYFVLCLRDNQAIELGHDILPLSYYIHNNNAIGFRHLNKVVGFTGDYLVGMVTNNNDIVTRKIHISNSSDTEGPKVNNSIQHNIIVKSNKSTVQIKVTDNTGIKKILIFGESSKVVDGKGKKSVTIKLKNNKQYRVSVIDKVGNNMDCTVKCKKTK